MATTGIEWTEHTWNPMVGCSIHSDGCRNCYAMRQAHRLEHAFRMPQYEGTTKRVGSKTVWTGRVNRATDRAMSLPARTRKPSVFFVNSMSDFWHEAAPPEARAEAWEMMVKHDRHIFQVLTKRPENIAPMLGELGVERVPDHIWIGTTVEDQRVLGRIDHLRRVPASILFLSCEPLIGPLDLRGRLDGIGWVISGGESGPGSRRMLPEWPEVIDDACQDAGVPHFFKQWGDISELGLKVGKHAAGHLLRGKVVRHMPHGVTLSREDSSSIAV